MPRNFDLKIVDDILSLASNYFKSLNMHFFFIFLPINSSRIPFFPAIKILNMTSTSSLVSRIDVRSYR